MDANRTADFMLTAGEDTMAVTEDKCECCGWPLVLADLLALARNMAGLDESACSTPNPGPGWCEVHRRDDTRGARRGTQLALQHHTPERCQRRRDGDPEPFEWSDEDGEDED